MSHLSEAEIRSARVLLFASLGIILLIGIAVYFTYSSTTWPPIKDAMSLEYPVYAHQSGDGTGVYVIDSSSRRVVKITGDGELGYTISGGSRTDGEFFYARELASAADGSLYLLNQRLDEKGFYLIREDILHYDAEGSFLETAVAKNYGPEDESPELVQRGTIMDIQVVNGVLHWYELGMDGVDSFRLSPDGVPELQAHIPFPGAQLHIASLYRVDSVSFIAVLKDASMLYASLNGSGSAPSSLPPLDLGASENLASSIPDSYRVFYRHLNSGDEEGLGIIPWSAVLTQNGVVFTDLENRSLSLLEPNGRIRTLMDVNTLSARLGEEVYPYYYYTLTRGGNGSIVTSNDEGVVIIQPNGDIDFLTEASYTAEQKLLSILFWLALGIGIAAFAALVRGFYVGVMKGRVSPLFVRALGLALLVLMVGGLSASIIIPNFSSRYQDAVLQRISQMLQVIPRVIDGDAIEGMSSPEAYHSEEYQELRQGLMETFNQNRDDWNKGYYFALYRVVNEKLYGFMYMNGLINPYYPFDWLGGEEEPGVYDLAQWGEIATELTTDISGDWIYGVGPIYNSQGQVVGLFETGTDLYALQSENNKLIRNLVLDLLTLLIVIILLVVETSFLAHLNTQKRQSLSLASLPRAGQEGEAFHGILFTRPIAFLFFAALSLSVAFLPILANRLYVPVEGQVADVLIALPLAIETLGFGVATLLAGFLVRALHWQGLFYSGLVFTAGGLVLSGLANDLDVLVIARAVVGLGSGLGYMGLRSIINREKEQSVRSRGFSNFYAGMTAGVNTGLVIGASIADVVGLQTVFFIAAGVLVLVLVMPSFIRLGEIIPAPSSDSQYVNPIRGIGTLLGSPKIWVFFIGMILPTYIAGSYIVYYFPLFAEAQGIGTADIGRLLIINGLCIVYLGPTLSGFIERRFGNLWGSIFGSLFWGVGLLISALTGSILGAVFALLVMGISEGFAVNSQNNVFLSFPAVKKVGADQAVGIYELMGKMGETLGPILFGLALLLGARFGLAVVAAVVAGLAFIVPLATGFKNFAPSRKAA